MVVGAKSWVIMTFQLPDDGQIAVWKLYKIGSGKVFSPDYLKKLYTRDETNVYPQGLTGSYFAPGVGRYIFDFIPKM